MRCFFAEGASDAASCEGGVVLLHATSARVSIFDITYLHRAGGRNGRSPRQ